MVVQLCETAEEDVELPCLGEDKRKWRRKSLCKTLTVRMKAVNLMEIIISKPARAFESPSSITDIRRKVCKVKSEKCEVFLS